MGELHHRRVSTECMDVTERTFRRFLVGLLEGVFAFEGL